MKNLVNCWKPKSKDMAISSQALKKEGSETILNWSRTNWFEAQDPRYLGDDIVRHSEKSEITDWKPGV